ncbi:hypothetical protein [Streptomyces sp. NBC_00258]|nr:hypothetical protein [Streptomyces sp. NBC_00258]
MTEDVYKKMADDGKLDDDGRDMWSVETREVGGEQLAVYRSFWGWVV